MFPFGARRSHQVFVQRAFAGRRAIQLPDCVSAIALCLCITVCGQGADAPAGAAQYRTGTLDPHVRQVPKQIQAGVFVDPDRYLEPLVRFLVDGARDEFHKVKRLHDWIAENIAYDVQSYFSGTEGGSSADSALAERRAVCFGYASLLNRMCSAADIRCSDISGYGRGYGFLSGRSADVSQVNHAWSAVQIDDRWYLVDATWDAGYVEGREFRKEYRTTYLFMDPRSFVFTHLPGDSRWQLLDQPLSNDQFSRLPYLLGPFFDHGLRLLTRLERVTSAGRSVQFSVHVPAASELMAKLNDADGVRLPQRTLVQHEADHCKVFVIFPVTGLWTVQLFARPAGSTENFSLAAELDFQTSEGASGTFFPKTYHAYGTLRGRLYGPLYLPLPTRTPLEFRVRLRGASDVSLAIGDAAWQKLHSDPEQPDIYHLQTVLPPGNYVRLNARTDPASKSYDTVIGFDVPSVE